MQHTLLKKVKNLREPLLEHYVYEEHTIIFHLIKLFNQSNEKNVCVLVKMDHHRLRRKKF